MAFRRLVASVACQNPIARESGSGGPGLGPRRWGCYRAIGVESRVWQLRWRNPSRTTRLVRGGKTTNLNNLLFLKYQLDNSANVTRIIDYRQAGQRQCFDYDDVGRLTVAFTGNDQCTTVDKDRGEAQYDVGFEYTASGNLRRRVDTVAKTNWWYTYPSGTHRVTRAGTHTLGYDGNGAMTPRTVSGVIQMLDYDKAHRLTGITGGGDTTRRVHAADYVGAEHRAISLWGLLRNPSYGPSVAAEIVFVQWFPRVERSLFQRLFQDPW